MSLRRAVVLMVTGDLTVDNAAIGEGGILSSSKMPGSSLGGIRGAEFEEQVDVGHSSDLRRYVLSILRTSSVSLMKAATLSTEILSMFSIV